MSEFWYTRDTMARLNPDYLRYEHFSITHLLIFAVSLAIIILTVYLFKKCSEEKRIVFIRTVAVLLILNELACHVAAIATNQWEWSLLPLHLCSINVFVCAYNAIKIKTDRFCADLLYATCVPGAFIALLMPVWNILPIFGFMSLNSQIAHILLIIYPLLLIANGFFPTLKNLPKVFGVLLAEATLVFIINKILDTNFFFLNGTANNFLMEFLASILGEKFYFIGFLPILAVLWFFMYLPWYLIEKKKNKITK